MIRPVGAILGLLAVTAPSAAMAPALIAAPMVHLAFLASSPASPASRVPASARNITQEEGAVDIDAALDQVRPLPIALLRPQFIDRAVLECSGLDDAVASKPALTQEQIGQYTGPGDEVEREPGHEVDQTVRQEPDERSQNESGH